MYILVDKTTKRIKAFSSSDISSDYDANLFVTYNVADEILEGYTTYYIDGAIVKTEIVDKKEVAKIALMSATTVDDLKSILDNFLS